MADKIGAVVVTFNRLPMLQQCLPALLAQTYKLSGIIVVDNASTDGTGDWARAFVAEHAEVTFMPLTENVGGAGGFYAGMEEALKRDWEWMLLLDDDAICQPDTVAKLIQSPSAIDGRVGVLATKVVDADGNLAPMNWPARYDFGRGTLYPIDQAKFDQPEFEVDGSSFVGFCVRSEVVKRIGLPRKEFFIHFDDIEFSLRIRRAGYLIKVIIASVIQHKITAMKSGSGAVAVGQLWKHYYGCRNEFYTGLRILGWPSRLLYFGRRIVKLGVVTAQDLRLDHPWQRISTEWRAFGDGLFGRLGKRN